MRKIFIFIAALCFTILVCQYAVLAAEPYELVPVNVIYRPNRMEIRRIYEMSPRSDPARLSRADFERNNVLYRHTDILREAILEEQTKRFVEIETIESARNDIESILRVLPLTRDVMTDDGFAGMLYLDISTIQSEVAGYGTRSSTVNITRHYPNMSSRDTQYIPKTITENGRTYTLANIQWQTDNTHSIDNFEISSRFTAIATYTGTRTTRYVRGYRITAEYSGEVSRTDVSAIRYTMIFSGTEITPPEPEPIPEPPGENESPGEPDEPAETGTNGEAGAENGYQTVLETDNGTEPDDENGNGRRFRFNWFFVAIPLTLLTAAGVVYAYLKKRKEHTTYEDIEDSDDDEEDEDVADYDSYDYDTDYGDGNPDDGDEV